MRSHQNPPPENKTNRAKCTQDNGI